MSIPVVVLLGVSSGTLTGLLGIGGGVIMLPALIYQVGLHTHKAAGTSLLLVWISSLAGAVNSLRIGNVEWTLLAILLTGGISGTWIGTHLSLLISGNHTRRYFVYVLLLAIVLVGGRIVAIMVG